MTTVIPELNRNFIKHCLLIDIYLNDTTYYISNAYAPVTFDGHTYTQLGHFLGMSEIQDDLKATNNQINIQLSGIPPDDGSPNYMNIALNSNLKGSKIKIWRAFFDQSGFFNPSAVYLRFNGYISNYSLNENWDQENKTTSNAIAIQCSNVHAILEKKYTGRRTNDTDQQSLYPGDTGMNYVKSLVDTQFDFGKPYSAPASSGGADTNYDTTGF
jgi:hypothetical protein